MFHFSGCLAELGNDAGMVGWIINIIHTTEISLEYAAYLFKLASGHYTILAVGTLDKQNITFMSCKLKTHF